MDHDDVGRRQVDLQTRDAIGHRCAQRRDVDDQHVGGSGVGDFALGMRQVVEDKRRRGFQPPL
jgi:hypothetical protein